MHSSQISEFGYILLFITGGLAFVILAMLISRLIRPNRPNPEKLSSYESGEEPVGNAWGQFNARFYIIALIFILFEVEIVFIFPWAVVFGDKNRIMETQGLWGWFSLVEMFVFIVILTLALVYAWAKGYLDWIKPEAEIKNYQSPVPGKYYEEINRKYDKKKNI
jgi:NADH-quinone oxidoreductase subunit A